MIMNNLQNPESCTLGSKDTNINISVTLKLAQNFFHFSQMLIIGSRIVFDGFQGELEKISWNL